MKFTDEQINSLRIRVKERLSEKRFIHTLGVEEMAIKIGILCLPERIDELRVASLLHDISKEYSEAEYFEIAKRHNFTFSEEDLESPALWHSITAPFAVIEDFPEYANEDILSAVGNHTTGSADMSVFDEIILLSDYIEEGRKYKNCIDVRKRFFDDISAASNREEYIFALHFATYTSLENNIKEFISRGESYHSRTKAARDAILKKTERQSNGNN